MNLKLIAGVMEPFLSSSRRMPVAATKIAKTAVNAAATVK
jgi:hypothetical protein